MRVYIPTTLTDLAAAYAAAELGPESIRAHAVTPALREWYLSDDREELEYAALMRAAQASLRRIAADPAAPRRRVVLAVDVPDPAVQSDRAAEQLIAGLGAVLVSGTVPLRLVASVHVDAEEAEKDVTAAVDAVAAADAGDDDAQFTVDGAEDHELLWYASQEIPELLG
jgi:hypothetical protein